MRRWLIAAAAAAVVFARPLLAQAAPAPVFDVAPLEAGAARLFDAQSVIGDGSDLNVVCGRVLLCFQALSALVIVAGLIMRIRNERTQMQGVAASLLKVAFIATIPAWRTLVLDTADVAAASIGYQSAAAGEPSNSVVHELWGLLGQWVPPGSPYLDVLTAQNAANQPSSGAEKEWGLQAWNWARGVGAADATLFHALWQAASGSIRACIIFGSSALMVCCLSAMIMLIYLGEMLRYVLFFGGCALLPVFVAGLSVDALRAQSVRFIMGTVTIAFWPLAWAIANVVTHFIVHGTETWIAAVTTKALAGAGLGPASLATAAPYLAWGVWFAFIGITVALCLWVFASVFYGPVLIGRAVTAGTAYISTAIESVPVAESAGRASGNAAGPSAGSAPRVSPGAPTRTTTTVRTLPAIPSASGQRGAPVLGPPAVRVFARLGSAARPPQMQASEARVSDRRR